MQNCLIKKAHIIDPVGPLHGQTQDIMIQDGIITEIAGEIYPSVAVDKIITANHLMVSIGWMDMRVNFGDPGNELREDLWTGARAASAGGFTAVACMGTTHPSLHSKAQIAYITNKSKDFPAKIYPVGTVTKNAEGVDLAELYDMYQSGAVAFSDNKNAIQNADLLQRAMLYAGGFGKKIIQIPCDKQIAKNGQMHEGIVSTSLGLKGIPALAEELMLKRDLMLAAHHNLPIHFGGISTAGSVAIIREAKQQGIQVSCDVHAINLLYTDEVLQDFNTNFKLNPPLRLKSDVEALIAGLQDGTIDVICSDHTPMEVEEKVKEFDIASFGIAALETFFGTLLEATKTHINITQIIEKISINPRKIMDIPLPVIATGSSAELTLFSTSGAHTFQLANSFSKGKNTPFNEHVFPGKVIGTIRERQIHLNA